MGAHTGGAMADATLERLSAACIDILDREAALGGRGFPRRLDYGPLLDPAAVENARFVEMDMRLDQAGHQEAARCIEFAPVSLQVWRDGKDRAAANANIYDTDLRIPRDASVTNDQVHELHQRSGSTENLEHDPEKCEAVSDKIVLNQRAKAR
jgi:hypothetical protein